MFDRTAVIIQCLRAGSTPIEIIKLFGDEILYMTWKYTQCQRISTRALPLRRGKYRLGRYQPGYDFGRLRTCLRKFTWKFWWASTIVQRITQEDLKYSSYELKDGQILSEASKLKIISHCKLLLSSLKHETAGRINWFYSDEKMIYVLSDVSSKGDVRPPHVFQKGETVTIFFCRGWGQL